MSEHRRRGRVVELDQSQFVQRDDAIGRGVQDAVDVGLLGKGRADDFVDAGRQNTHLIDRFHPSQLPPFGLGLRRERNAQPGQRAGHLPSNQPPSCSRHRQHNGSQTGGHRRSGSG